jgi:hypothetical protein
MDGMGVPPPPTMAAASSQDGGEEVVGEEACRRGGSRGRRRGAKIRAPMPAEIQLGHRRTGARNEGKEGGHHVRSSVEEEKAEGADVHGPDPR